MKLHQIPERWATVWGVGWDYEVVEIPLWKPMSVAQFGGPVCHGGHIEKFRMVTDWAYTKPQDSSTPMSRPKDWQQRKTAAQEWFLKERQAVVDEATGFTNVAGYRKLREWQASQRPDLEPPGSMDWAYESIRLERQASVC